MQAKLCGAWADTCDVMVSALDDHQQQFRREEVAMNWKTGSNLFALFDLLMEFATFAGVAFKMWPVCACFISRGV